MKNLLNNLLNWVLKKGPSETKKDQAWEEKEQAGSKKEQAGSKKDQVKRTKLSEKDQVKGSKLVKRTKLVQKRTKLSEKEQAEQKGNKLGEKGTSLEMKPCVMGSEVMSANHALITQLSRNNHPISLRAIRYAAVLFMVFMVGIGNAWGTDKYYILGAQAVASDGALTKASSHSYLTLKYIKYDGSTYATTTDISFSATAGINGKYESSAASANISGILTSSKWGTGSASAYAAGIKFAKSTTYTLALGSLIISKISFLCYPEGKKSSVTIGETAKTTSSQAWTLHEWTGSFTGNVSMTLSSDNGVYGVFVLETASSCTPCTFKSGDKVYFKDQSSNFDFDALWKVSSGNVYAYFWNETENAWSDPAGTCVDQSWNSANAIYELTVPGSGKEYQHVIFTRGNNNTCFDCSSTWDKTTNQEPCEGKNLFYVSKDKYADHIYYGSWGNFTPASKTVYFDNRNVTDWTTAYVRIGHGTNNAAWGTMTKVAGTRNLYSQTTSKYISHTDFSIANKAGWTGSNHIDQPEKTYENGSWSSSEYKMTKQTNYQQYAIEDDIYLCPKATSVLEHECQFYQVTNTNSSSSSRIDENTTALSLPQYKVVSTTEHCTVDMVQYTNDALSTSSALSSGSNVDPTRYVGVTVSPSTGYEFGSVTLTENAYEQHTAAGASVTGKYAIMANCTITAVCTPITYSITYKDGGNTSFTGVHIGTQPTEHTYATATALKKASKAGYVFGGWYTASDCKSGLVTSLGATDYTADITLYAKWTAISMVDLASGTFYGASAMVPAGVTVSGTEQAYPGVSTDQRFNMLGASTSDAMASKTMSSKSLTNASAVTEYLDFKGSASVSSYVPSTKAVQFKIPAAGQLEIWANSGIYLSNGSSETSISPSDNYATATVAAGTYYLYAKNTSRQLYGIRFKKTHSVSAVTSTGTTTYGTVSASPTTVVEGGTSTVTAVPATGYQVTNWAKSGTGASISPSGLSNSNTTTLTMGTADATVTVTFGAIDYSVTYSSPSNGDYTIKVGSGSAGSSTKTANYGNTITLAATPDEGYVFDSWTITNTSTSADVTTSVSLSDANDKDATFTMPNYGVTVMATFVSACSTPADPDGLAAGSISSSGVTFTITDDESPASYEIYYSTDDDAPEASTVASATTTSKSKAVTGLTANTTYYAWVRAVCNDDYKSDWVALTGSTFKTLAAGTKYYLFTPTSAPNPSHTGTLSGQFHTFANSAQSSSETISTYTFSHWAKTSGGKSSWDTDNFGQLFIVYDIKTNNTDFTIYYKNGNGSTAKGFYYAIITEGQTTDPTATLITGEKIAGQASGSYTFNIKASKNSRICFFGEANNDCRFYQIVAEEMGSALPKPGEAGYKLAFSGVISRFAVKSSSDKTGFVNDSILVNANSNQKYGKSSTKSGALKLTTKGTNYLSFRSGASACQVKVCVSSSKTYYLGTSKSATTNEQTSTHTFALAANTRYYINPNGSDVMVDSIVFLPAPAGFTVSITADPAGYGSVSSSSVTSVASGTSLSTSTNTLSVGATDVTATATSASAEYTYSFNNWTKGDGTALPSTVTSDLSVRANFTRSANSYTLTWNANGGSDGACTGSCTSGSTAYNTTLVAPTDPTKSNYTFDGWNTANDGSGSAAAATMPASDVTYYAAWKQMVTLTTGAQGSGDNQTPYVYLNGTGVSSITPHTADGYTLQGYYTAGSGGVKVLNADGTFASANVDGYITSGKWSRTGAAPTLYAQWVAAEDCHTLKYAWKASGKFCDDESTSVTASDTVRFQANASNLYFTVSGTGNTVSKGSSYNLGNTQNNYFLLTAKTGYQIKSICFYGKVQDSSVDFTTDGSSWSALASKKTDEDKYYTFDDIDASAFGIKLTAATPEGVWIRNMVIEVCAEGGTTYNVTYDDNGKTGGSVPTDATDYSYGDAVTVKGNTGSLEKTNYTFAGWTTNDDGTGSSYVADNTFSITANTTLYAKWTQAVTFDANTANHGSTGGSATAVWNATGLTGITHATPASGYKLLGYYTDATEGTKVLNSDGTFASSNVTDYITSGKWSRTGAAPTLYAQYEASGSLKWNLGVKTTAESLTTSSKESSFTEISTSNMSNATVYGVTYTPSSKNNLTGQISTPAVYEADKYVYVTFKVADGYKFTPSSISVKVQPVGENEHKAVKLSLADATNTLVSGSPTKCDGTSSGKTTTVTLAGNGTYFTGTVTLKIYVYADETASATTNNCYRLGTPIEIQGAIEAACTTMPSFTQMNYSTTTFAPSADASGSPITIVGGENIDTYQWKYNTVNDRTSGTNCGTGTSFTPLTNAGAAIDVTRYYWCEMTNEACGITIKSPAVAITVAAAKSDATVTWTGTTASAYYGGGGYTVTATVSTAEWDGTLTEDMLTAMDGVVLSNINVTNDGKTITADFGVTEGANAEATNVEFYLNHPATTDYNAIDETYNTTTLVTSCISAGGGDGSSYDVRVRKNTTTILQGKSTVYGWDTPTKGFVTQSTGGSVTSGKSGYDDVPVFDSISKNNAKAYWVKSYVANVKKIRVYGQVGDDDLTATGVYHVGSFVAGGSSTAVAYSVVYEDEVDALKKGNHWFEITLDEAISTNDIIYFTVNKNFKIMGVRLTTVGAGGATLETALSAWSPVIDTRKEVNEDAASFVETVTKTGVNANTMGAITYSSGDETIATVDNRTGRVTIANSITWGDAITYKDVTITASLAPSGCYQGKTATYTLRVNKLTCTEAAGTITASSEGSHVVIEGDEVKKCTSETVTLTLGGYEEGATSFQWYKDGVLQGDKTTASITTSEAGVWYAVSNKGCAVTSTNEITIINRSTSAHVTRLVKEWYIKNGRLTPDIALWELGDDCSFVSVTASDGWDANTGLTAASSFYEQDGIVYLKGTEPKANDGAVQNYTLTLTVNDGCSNQTLNAEEKEITIHHQQNTDKHVLAFVVNGTEKGDWTAGVTADQTTNVGLYNAIAAQFDVQATNIYATDDEKKLKEYYSQYDILCITDYPNTKTKGVNSKSYVDAMGALVDIRPILTMEAWVSGLTNWKAKGISGTPSSPTTRQYTMLLQCKDHEIFSGTELTKVGEGDETMYRVSMVCDTLEDYKTLDATYGAGTHEKDKNYQYGKKPALQGFTFDATMADDGLLPLGLIDDGAGNDLEVGIERQAEMSARLMVLGVNSYAMERLTKDGQKVIINALNYLMKKKEEEIADCSITFIGGDETNPKDWETASNWKGGQKPDKTTREIRILAPVVITDGQNIHAQAPIKIASGGTYNDGADKATGKITIEAGGALRADGEIQAVTAPAYSKARPTSVGDIHIKSSLENGNGTLIFKNDEGTSQAIVEMYSKASFDGGSVSWQYIAVPFATTETAYENYYGSWLYRWAEDCSGWDVIPNRGDVGPWIGYCITQVGTKTYTMTGKLVETTTQEFSVPAGKEMVIGNSWTAPIQVKQFTDDDFSELNANVYLFNTGYDPDGEGGSVKADRYEAGTYVTIPIHAASYTGDSLISSLQAFIVNNKAGGSAQTLTLDYDRHVRPTRATDKVNAGQMHAPVRRAVVADGEPEVLKLFVSGSRYDDRLVVLAREDFSAGFDNGWDGQNINEQGDAPMMYALREDGTRDAVSAVPEFEGTVVGFQAGEDDVYTMSFVYAEEAEPLYILDTDNETYTRVLTDNTYTFMTSDKDAHSRFVLTRTSGMRNPTGCENVDGSVKAKKFILNDKMYIMVNGVMYDATGKLVK